MTTNITPTDSQEFIKAYEAKLNTHNIEEATEFLDKNAVFWFGGYYFNGLNEIKQAYTQEWEYTEDEMFHFDEPKFIVETDNVVVCLHKYHWTGLVGGTQKEGKGRGTMVLVKNDKGDWKIKHQNLNEDAKQ